MKFAFVIFIGLGFSESLEAKRRMCRDDLEYLGEISQSIKKHPLLSHEEHLELFKLIKTGGPEEGEAARQKLIQSNLRLVISIALNYRNRGLPLSDLMGEGNAGLIKAVDGFEPERGFRLSTFASTAIENDIKNALSKATYPVRVPHHIVAQKDRVTRVRLRLKNKNRGVDPSMEELVRELALELQIPSKTARSLIKGEQRLRRNSVSNVENDEGELVDVFSVLPTDGSGAKSSREIDEEILKAVLLNGGIYKPDSDPSKWVRWIDEREALILRHRFGIGEASRPLKYEIIGEIVKISEQRVSVIVSEAFKKLKYKLNRLNGVEPE